MNFLLVEGIHSIAQEQLTAHGFKVEQIKTLPTEKSFLNSLNAQKITGLCIRSRTQITKNLLQATSSHLRVIGAFCIGTDQIDLKTACQMGVPVFNAPYGNTRSVAELTIGHIIYLARQCGVFNHQMHHKKWHKHSQGSREVRGKTLGIVGYGHIGTQVGILAESLGMKVLYFDIIDKLPIGNAHGVKSLRELLSLSDIVTLHVPETPLTKNLIRAKQLQWMKKNTALINTSRGCVVNLEDLKSALLQKHLKGVALDVFPDEPLSSKADFITPLQDMQQAILTPHIAGSTQEAQANIARQVSASLSKYLLYGISEGAVNFPALNPPMLDQPDRYQRLVNIHKNVPGVLANINGWVSRLKINIKTQQLATNNHIGYLVMDIEKENHQELCQAISRLDISIRTFILPLSCLSPS